MFWWVVGFINVVLAVIELIIGLRSKDRFLLQIHIMYSLMFISYIVAAYNQNLLFGIPGLIIGLLAVFLNSKNRRIK